MDKAKANRIKLLEQVKKQKCPGCKSLHKTIDMKEDGSECSCQCEQCCKQWKIKLEA